jgi:Protein of unknown function (DUF4232)
MKRTASVIAVVAWLLAACTSGPSPHRIVPWVDRPAPAYTPSPPPAPRYPSAAPCRASELRLAGVRPGAAAGTVYTQVSLRDVSSRPCELRGLPRITAVDDHGVAVRLPTVRLGWMWPTAAMRPGSITAFVLATSDICTSGRTFRDLSLVVPGGRIPFLSRYDIRCLPKRAGGARASLSRFGVPALAKPPAAPVSPLRIEVRLPRRVEASSTLHYTVAITNTGKRPYRLQPCPTYEEGLVVGAGRTGRNYHLNCDAVHVIDPHRAVRYAMVIRVPNRSGVGKFSWDLHVTGEPARGFGLRILPRSEPADRPA